MAFDALQVKAVEGLISFTNTIRRPSINWRIINMRGRERKIGKSEMNNFKRQQQPHLKHE